MNNDLISRQAVLDVITVALNGFLTDDERERLEDMCVEIEEMPPAVKRGKWIKDRLISTNGGTYGVRRCSVCEAYYQDVGYGWNFCPNCGAKMESDTND